MIISEGSTIKINEDSFKVLKISSEVDKGDLDEEEENVYEPLGEYQEILLHKKGIVSFGPTHVLKIYYQDKTQAHLVEISQEDSDELDSLNDEILFVEGSEKVFDIEDIEVLD